MVSESPTVTYPYCPNAVIALDTDIDLSALKDFPYMRRVTRITRVDVNGGTCTPLTVYFETGASPLGADKARFDRPYTLKLGDATAANIIYMITGIPYNVSKAYE